MLEIAWGKTVAHSFKQYAHRLCAVEAEGAVFRWVVLALLMTVSTAGMADDPEQYERVPFDIPQLRADLALIRFAEQADLTLIFPFDEVWTKTANRLVGNYSLQEGAQILLMGTGLKPTVGSQTVLTIVTERPLEPEGEGMNVTEKKVSVAKKAGFGSVLAAIFGFGAGVGADAVAQEQTADVKFDEIIVSARKREERLLDIPITISVLTKDDIDVKGINDLEEVVDFSPGFHYGGPSGRFNARTNRRLIIRGMQPDTDVQTMQAASILIDGAAVLGSEVGSLEGVERIEVVRGPQSAYFGRATFAGAINFITRVPNLEKWQGKVKVDFAEYNKVDVRLSAEGPLVKDKLGVRISYSEMSTDGQYDNWNKPGETLGDRSTDDLQATFYASPTDSFNAKLRLHYWEDDDGPAASFGYGLLNGIDVFNCNPGGTAIPINGANNWVCGTPRQPRPEEIGLDTICDEPCQVRLRQEAPGQLFLTSPSRLHGYGMVREAFEASLAMDYTFGNDISIEAIFAAHENERSTLADGDNRMTGEFSANPWGEPIPGCDFCYFPVTSVYNVAITGPSDIHREDSSFEFRVISADHSKIQWLVGANYMEVEEYLQTDGYASGFWYDQFPADLRGMAFHNVETVGVFGSIGYSFNDFSVSLEGRYQEDLVSDGQTNVPPGYLIEKTFYSFNPRIIVDYKPNEELMIYGSFAQGSRPGTFNSILRSQPQSVLDCIAEQVGADVYIPEEQLDNLEFGVKGRLWGGRATVSAAVYVGEWTDQHNRSIATCQLPDGSTDSWAINGLGGSTDLSGVEVEFAAALTDNLTLEGTFAYNKTDILSRDCSDCQAILGDREHGADGNSFGGTPETSGTLSASYIGNEWANRFNFFSRVDYIYRGTVFATAANIAETGDMHRVNLRLGVERDALRLEAYATNLFDDDTFSGFSRFQDWVFRDFDRTPGVGYNMLSVGLPVKRVIGIRASYEFGGN
jgi:iron complex outermembrane receptor protein